MRRRRWALMVLLALLATGFAAPACAQEVLMRVLVNATSKGRLAEGVAIEQARTEQLLHQYEQSILTAFREVEDAIVATNTYREEYAARRQQVESATNAADLSWIRPLLIWGGMGAMLLIVAALLFGNRDQGQLALLAAAGLWRVWRHVDPPARTVLVLLIFHTLLILPILAVRVFLSFDAREVAQGRHILLPAASAFTTISGCSFSNSADISRNGTESEPAWKMTSSLLCSLASFLAFQMAYPTTATTTTINHTACFFTVYSFYCSSRTRILTALAESS